MNHQQRFDVGGVGRCADRVEVALHELAIATLLSVLAAPNGADVIPLERCADLVDVLRDKTSQRNGQVESQRDIAAAVVEKAEQLLVGLFATFAEQNLGVLQRGRVDR